MPAIHDLARRIGELRAAELTAFETLGAWALDGASPPDDRVAFAACAHRAAWRAGQLADRAPVLAALPPDDAVRPGDDELASVAAVLADTAVGERVHAAEHLGALLAAAYAVELEACGPTDRPSRRLFARLLHDVTLPT